MLQPAHTSETKLAKARYAPLELRHTAHWQSAFTVTSPAGLTVEDILAFDFWRNVVKQLKANDLIEVIAAEGSFDVELRLVHIGNSSISFRKLREWRPKLQDLNDHWAVIRNSNPDEVKRWVLAHGAGNSRKWTVLLRGDRQFCVVEAVRLAISGDLGLDQYSPSDVLNDPNYVPEDHHVTMLCPQREGEVKTWVEYRVRKKLGDADIAEFLEGLAAEGDVPFDKSMFHLWPRATDLLSREELAAWRG